LTKESCNESEKKEETFQTKEKKAMKVNWGKLTNQKGNIRKRKHKEEISQNIIKVLWGRIYSFLLL